MESVTDPHPRPLLHAGTPSTPQGRVSLGAYRYLGCPIVAHRQTLEEGRIGTSSGSIGPWIRLGQTPL
jgi:hypothetical protein